MISPIRILRRSFREATQSGIPLLAILLTGMFGGPSPAMAQDDSTAAKPVLVVKYDDGKADGKKSLGGSGEVIRFELPQASQKLRAIRLHCARYGTPKAPEENAEFSIVGSDGSEIIHQESVPYSKFKRGDMAWTTVEFKEPVDVPSPFFVVLNFDAQATKGVYVSYDTSNGGKHSQVGLPGGDWKAVDFGGDWMIQAILTKP